MRKVIMGLMLSILTMSCVALPGYYFDPKYDSLYDVDYNTRREYKLNHNDIPRHFNDLHYAKMFEFGNNFGSLVMKDINIINGRVYMDFNVENINYTNDRFSFEISSDFKFDGRYVYLVNVRVEDLDVSKYIDTFRLRSILESKLEKLVVSDIYMRRFTSLFNGNRLLDVYVRDNGVVGLFEVY